MTTNGKKRLSLGLGYNPFGTPNISSSPDVFGVPASPGSTLVTPLTSPRHLYFQSKSQFKAENFSLIYAAYVGNLNLVKKYIEIDKIDPCVADYDNRSNKKIKKLN